MRYGTDRETALRCDSHSHEMAPNPFTYSRHRSSQPSLIAALPQATAMRNSTLPYRQAERILYGQGLKLDRKTYYNLARGKSMGTTQDDLLALVSVLEHDDWIYRTYWEFRKDDQGKIIAQVLKAVFFTSKELIQLARRFCPDWMIQMDGTFNTNKLRMPLIDVLGVTNTEHSFLFAFCFVTSESAENWGFVLQCLEMTVFKGLPLPRVVIADQGMGLRSVFHQVWIDGFLQFCEWHAADNMKKRLASKRYKKEERKVIMDLVWKYLWSATEQTLEENRIALKNSMKTAEVEYLEKYWVPKESQLIRLYTNLLPNLNCFSTQRDEGQHPMIKTVLNHQLRLDEAVRRLALEMKLATERLQEYEQNDRGHGHRLLEANTWYLVSKNVTSVALMRVLEQWDLVTLMKRVGQPLGRCECTLVERFGLPCYHDLEQAYDLLIPLPLTLIHSRWWYQAGIEVRAGWRPLYGIPIPTPTDQILLLEQPSHHIITTTNKLLQFREGLTRERQQRLDEAHVRATQEILQEEQRRQYFNSTVPAVLPAPITSTWNRYAKTHDKTMKRMMTGTEAAVKDADAAEAADTRLGKQVEKEAVEQAKQKEKEAAIDDDLLADLTSENNDDSDHSEIREVVFSTPISPPRTMLPPPRPTTPEVSRKRSITLVHRTPEKPRAAPVVPTTPSNTFARETYPVTSTPQEPAEIPASTAPARLDGRERRAGKNTAYLEAIAIEQGPGRGVRGGRGGRGGKA
jgi:hypothetical protein